MKELKRMMFIAPRYHTNQIAAVETLIKNNIEVTFVTQYADKTEDYTLIKPHFLGYSKFIKRLINSLKCDDNKKGYYSRLLGIPPLKELRKIVKDKKPQLAIVRDRTLYCLVCMIQLKLLGVKCVLYTQIPKYATSRTTKSALDLLKKLYGKYEITPLLGKQENLKIPNEKNIFVVPLIFNPKEEYRALMDDKIRIIVVSEFAKRKRIIEILKSINLAIKNHVELEVTIIGNNTKDITAKELQKIKQYIADSKLTNTVRVYENKEHKEVMEILMNHNIFILNSIKEAASYALIEAMGYGLCCIANPYNGTTEYLESANKDFIVFGDDPKDIFNILLKLNDNIQLINRGGKKNYDTIKTNYSSNNYMQAISKLWLAVNTGEK